ncbi:T9SS type A sorting domain-containing protein [Pontibacter sp. H249]|uniref:T9SS type A sorting domain-containing protein n=1 Tax=Pontibacter sp. H249 TaxID=3133420 RepID=UPI0030C3BD08
MKNIYSLIRLSAVLSLLIFFSASNAKAQVVEEAVCSYEDECLLIAYETIQEESPDSPTLLVVLSVFLNNSGNCSNYDGLVFQPAGGALTLLTRAQLAENSFVELTVDRETFTETPDVLISPFRYRRIPFFGFVIPVPMPPIVDLQARLDSEDPCLPITPLAVELISFTGKATESGINLEWSTASEENNSHFDVERSTDGKSFEKIAKIEGNGNSNTVIKYSFNDTNPQFGENYYRLRQADFDGQFEYSKTIAVNNIIPEEMQVMMYPNPCRGGDCEVLVRGNRQSTQTLLELKDMSGRVVLSKVVQNGLVRFTADEINNRKGLFILTATSGNEVVQQRVILE